VTSGWFDPSSIAAFDPLPAEAGAFAFLAAVAVFLAVAALPLAVELFLAVRSLRVRTV